MILPAAVADHALPPGLVLSIADLLVVRERTRLRLRVVVLVAVLAVAALGIPPAMERRGIGTPGCSESVLTCDLRTGLRRRCRHVAEAGARSVQNAAVHTFAS